MSMRADDLRDWVDGLIAQDKNAEVGVDDGGLCLRVVGDPEPYIEIGGLPELVDEEEN